MVLILSDKENKIDRELIEILSCKGAAIVSDNKISESYSHFTVVNRHTKTKIEANRGAVIVSDNINNFKNQHLSKGLIGICTESNKNALTLFKQNSLSVITCGTGNKNTLSVSSITGDSMLLCLQRSIRDINGQTIEPCEIKIALSRQRDLFSCLAAIAVMLIYKIGFDDIDICF